MNNKHYHNNTHVPADLSKFYVVTVISNSRKYKRRYELYWRFRDMCRCAGVTLITVEQAFGDRPFMITESNNPHHVQLRSHEELWHKENMCNIGAQRVAQLDPLAREICFIDADLRPMAQPRQWFEDTWHALQHYECVQMFECLIDLDYDHNPLGEAHNSFMASYHKGGRIVPKKQNSKGEGYQSNKEFWWGAPGGAWAYNLSAFNKIGGLIDFCILGSADWHMAQGLLGILEPRRGEVWTDAYSHKLYNWQERALRWIKKDVGYVQGGLMHDNHSPKKQRFYSSRKNILVKHKFDPNTDLKYDHQGLLQLETWDDRQIELMNDIRNYMASRREDVPEYRA